MAASLPHLMRRRVIQKFKEAGAVSKDTAKTIEELDLNDAEASLLKKNEERWRSVGVIKKYYVKKDPKITTLTL